MPLRKAEHFKRHVQHLLVARVTHEAVELETATWIANLDDKWHAKLAEKGLVQARQAAIAMTLAGFLETYFARRTDVKPATKINWGHTQRCLVEFFGADRLIDSITSGDAKDFERWLGTNTAREHAHGENAADTGLAQNTVRKRISNAKQFFADAVSRELIPRNPFQGLKSNTGGNRKRDYFLTRADAEEILDVCPDAQWRLIFALSRYGGLRCPSEHLALRWDDIDWDTGRFIVHSSKDGTP